MICVFFPVPMVLGPTTVITPINGRATTAATEATNVIEWLIQVG